jgi:hypothetical protein
MLPWTDWKMTPPDLTCLTCDPEPVWCILVILAIAHASPRVLPAACSLLLRLAVVVLHGDNGPGQLVVHSTVLQVFAEPH